MIPREGVESRLRVLSDAETEAEVIPREGVERNCYDRWSTNIFFRSLPVIPREGVESQQVIIVLIRRQVNSDPERGS